MKAMFTLTSAESKRLLAKAAVRLPEVQEALREHMIIVGGGTTNAFVLEELTGERVDKSRYSAGIITKGRQCLTPKKERMAPAVLVKGKKSDLTLLDATKKLGKNDVFFKGGNAIDAKGNVGVLVANLTGGTIADVFGTIVARGVNLILPVGLEKMIPDVLLAANVCGINTFERAIGKRTGLFPISYGYPFTELDALETLADVDAYCVSAGGVGGSEGAVVLVVEGKDEQVELIMELIKGIKGEPQVASLKQDCETCKECDLMVSDDEED